VHASAGPLRACVNVADCYDPFFAGTLICIKSLETCVESDFTTVPKRVLRTIRLCVHIIELPNLSSKMTILKIIISSLSKSESESFTILFYGNPLTSKSENMSMSRRWKAELVAYGSRKQHLPRFTLSVPLKPDHSSVCPFCPESVRTLS
jgi:hypothetical protein